MRALNFAKKGLILAVVSLSSNAHAESVYDQYGAGHVLHSSSDFKVTCLPEETANPAGEEFAGVWAKVNGVIETKSGPFTFVIAAYNLYSKSIGVIADKTADEACEGAVQKAKSEMLADLGTLFDVQAGNVQVGDHGTCFVYEVRLLHELQRVDSYSFPKRLVHCP